MYLIHKNGGAIVRPVLFDYPHLANDIFYEDQLEDSYMFGESLMVAPTMNFVGKYSIFFPKGAWVNVNSQS